MPHTDWQTCPPAVRAQVERLTAGFRQVIADHLAGVYLHGSLALGCFNPARSDLDLLILTSAAVSPAQKRALARLLLEQSGQPAPVEVSVLRRAYLEEWQHPCRFDFHYSESWREKYTALLQEKTPSAWTGEPATDADLAGHLTVTRARSICLWGLPPQEAIPPVPEADYLDSVLADVLDEKYGLDSPTASPVYVVLNACRTLAYLQTHQVLSKREGGEWAQERLPACLQPVVAAALAAYEQDSGDERLPRETLRASGFAAHMRRAFAAAR